MSFSSASGSIAKAIYVKFSYLHRPLVRPLCLSARPSPKELPLAPASPLDLPYTFRHREIDLANSKTSWLFKIYTVSLTAFVAGSGGALVTVLANGALPSSALIFAGTAAAGLWVAGSAMKDMEKIERYVASISKN